MLKSISSGTPMYRTDIIPMELNLASLICSSLSLISRRYHHSGCLSTVWLHTQKLPRRTPREPRTIFTSTQFRVRPWWWGRLGSNQRPIGYEPTALTPELRPRETYYSASEVIIEVFRRQFAQLLTKK